MPNEEQDRFREALDSLSDDVGGLWSPIYRQIPILEQPPNALDFLRDYVSPSQPCIIRGAVQDTTECPGHGDRDSEHVTCRPLVLTLDNLVEHAGECTVTVNVTPDGHGDCVRKVYVSAKVDEAVGNEPKQPSATAKMFVKPEQRTMTLEEFRDALRSDDDREQGEKFSSTSEGNIAEDLRLYPIHSASNNDSLNETNPNGQVLYYSQQNDCLRTELRSLFERDVVPRSFEFAEEAFGTGPPDAVNLWVGDERAVSSMHKDHYENLFYVASGEKIFTLCPPADVPFLHLGKYRSGTFQQLAMPDKTSESSSEREMSGNSRDNRFPRASRWVVIVDEQAVDDSDVMKPAQQMIRWIEPDIEGYRSRPSSKYPLLQYAHPLQVKVKTGEMLYIPSLWFHRVTQSCETVGINYWYDMKFDGKWCYFNFLQVLSDPDHNEDYS